MRVLTAVPMVLAALSLFIATLRQYAVLAFTMTSRVDPMVALRQE